MNFGITLKRIVPLGLSYMASGGSLIAASFAQLITFAILARTIGTQQFALFVAISAFANVAVQICGLGAQECLVRRVARDRSVYPLMMGHSLILSAGTGLILVLVGMATMPAMLSVSSHAAPGMFAIALLLIANIFLIRFISLATASYIAHSNFAAANTLDVGFAVIRTAAAVLGCLVFGVRTVEQWAVWMFASHMIVAAICAVLIWRMGTPKFRLATEELRIGTLFSTQFIFKAIRQNTDLIVLSMVTSAEVVGSYGVARRVLDSSYLSVEALNRLMYPGSAVVMVDGFHSAGARVGKMLLAAVLISLLAASAIYILAPLMPLLFGNEYVSMVGFTRALCWVVVAIAITSVAMEAFGAAGKQGVRAIIFNGANIIAAGLVALATLQAGVSGAFTSYYLVEIATAAVAWLVLLRFIQADRLRFASA